MTFGTTPRQYIEHRRIEAAKSLLEHSPDDLKQNAHNCGFPSVQAMCRSFVRHLGTSPDACRRQLAPSA